MKPVIFLGDSHPYLQALPDTTRRAIGFQIHRLQLGLMPKDFKSMNSIGKGVYEIRIAQDRSAFRVIYTLKFRGTVYVLHIFEKKSRRTHPNDILTAKRRYSEILENDQNEADTDN